MRDALDALDTKMLTRHALAFGLYLLSTTFLTVTIMMFNIDNDKFQKINDLAYVVDYTV